ncbi:MAG: aspartate--tRNA ligase [Buchnera aphidicola (Periphyllus lyropictus)]|uniref:aspartate--tRNA ligase n=1 Tax=Buchnera aphidicola TaxID=9 RepID=UPI001EB3D0D4|nr:aspartate--tRNA ligase [Buchnera aphidicola (Periphyllus lyropictus)]
MRTNYCGKINIKYIEKKITICGWVNKKRNFGKIIFLDIRDREGCVQVVFYKKNKELFKKVKKIKVEFCVQISGIVKERNKKNKNFNLYTGEIEIIADILNILNTSKKLPLDFDSFSSIKNRLKFRYLDIRKSKIIKNLNIRHLIVKNIINFLNKNNFWNIETPILTSSTPEGARDYLVPSRVHKGKFYALPQSPQLFKQLLMISGVDRYYQIVKCFRDEDLRSNRQPEFTQIDIEASFISKSKLCKIIEKMIIKLWLKIKNVTLKNIQKISFKESMNRFGTDKPDLRNPLEIISVKNILLKSSFFIKKFNKKKQRIVTLKIPNVKNLTLKKINSYIEKLKKYKINDIILIKVKDIKLGKIFTKNKEFKKINLKIIKKIIKKNKANKNDFLILAYDSKKIINKAFGKLRNFISKNLNLINLSKWSVVWVKNFPMFKKNKNNSFSTTHHPFTLPKYKNLKEIVKKPKKIFSHSYDLVINGQEIGGGSVRINNKKIQKKIFKIIGLTKTEQKKKFGFFLNSLEYGTPPHAGIALGLDRISMLLTNSNNISDVIAFPKTTSANCLITKAPNIVKKNDLNELGIKIIK